MIRNMNVEIEKLPAEQRETFRKLLLSPVENMIKGATDCEATGKIGDRIVPPSRR
jgi:hypothetical protein